MKKLFKRGGSLLLAFALVLQLTGIVSVKTLAAGATAVTVESKTIQQGTTQAELNVTIKDADPMAMMYLEVICAEELTLGTITSTITAPKPAINANRVSFDNIANGEDFQFEDGIIMTIPVSFSAELEAGDYSVEVRLLNGAPSSCGNMSEENVQVSFNKGTITVTDPSEGGGTGDSTDGNTAEDVAYYFGFTNNKEFVENGLTFAGGATQFSGYYAYAITAGKTARVQITDANRAALADTVGYKGNLTVEVEYYIGAKLPTAPSSDISIAQNFELQYGARSGDRLVLKTISLTDDITQDSTEYTKKAVFALDYADVVQTYGGVEYFAFDIINNGSAYLAIKSVKATFHDYKPAFVTTDETYPDVFYDNQPFEDIIIKNNYRAKQIMGEVTYTLDGKSQKDTISQVSLPAATDSFVALPAAKIEEKLRVGGAYQDGAYTMQVVIAWNKIDQLISRTYKFSRKNTIKRDLYLSEGNVWYSVTHLDAENAPNYYVVSISGDSLEKDITKPITSYLVFENGTAKLDLTGKQNLPDGVYTVGVASYYKEEGSETGVERTKDTVTFIKCSHDETYYDDANDKTCNKCGFVRAINGANLTLGTKMDYNVYVGITEEQAEGAYAVIKQNGTIVEEKGEVTYHSDRYGYKISLPGLAAKELCDELTVEVYDKYGNKISEVTESFAAYAYRTIEDVGEANDETRLIAYMIDYATEAQGYFGYNSEQKTVAKQFSELGNIDLNVYRTSVNTACETERTVTYADPSYNGSYVGTNFVLEENITMNLFTTNNVGYAEITFTDYLGGSHTMNIEATKANERVEGYYVFNISEFVTADGGVKESDGTAIVVTASFYDNATDKNLIVTVTDSMVSYVNRATKDTEFLATMMKFTTSARTYFETR